MLNVQKKIQQSADTEGEKIIMGNLGQMKRQVMHSIDGFIVILHYVRNVYPVEKEKTGWAWGFKFSDGFFEYFTYRTKQDAEKTRKGFIEAIRRYWEDA